MHVHYQCIQARQLEELAKDVLKTPSNCEEFAELTTLLDAIKLSLLARQLQQDSSVEEYSMSALVAITTSPHLTGEHRKYALALIDSLVRQSEQAALELLQDQGVLNRVLGGNVNQSEHIAHLLIAGGIVLHKRARSYLQSLT